MRSYRVAAAALLFACGPVLLHAQNFSLSGGGVYASLNGSDFDGFGSGLGVDAQFRYHARGGVSIGGGVQYTSHDITGVDPNLGVRAFFADVRYAFERASSPSITPYIGARVALAHYGVSQGGNSVTANGTAFGPAGGILVKLAPTTQLDAGIVWYSVHFGDAKVNGATQSGTKSRGSSLALRAGVVFGFGKK
ncbi:MAG TPA: outer membrane beta-barrel protein [Gemmatimonadales bacterium]|nr:outer membrane beta-barrel protein [Gemmatimonadales bacterium]